jgi:hypothetical protein
VAERIAAINAIQGGRRRAISADLKEGTSMAKKVLINLATGGLAADA